ncbi:MAG: sugar kinase [Chloroflexi bacterium]|nr:sugar kinase [Chloroflexota bacterium]
MSILVVGSVGLDDVQTPMGCRRRVLGGACTYFAAAASLYTQVRIVAVVGTDFPQDHIDLFVSRQIDLRGLQVVEGETFFWSGLYRDDLDACETLDTRLNVFADFHPTIPDELRDSEYLFLANIDPELQLEVLDQMHHPRLTALDSMNFWITSKKAALIEALSRVDVVLLNESEIKLLTQQPNWIAAAEAILGLGPRALIVKRGAHGAALVTRGESVGDRFFMVPAYPLDYVVDPTGAGDTFAAGFMGYLAKTGDLSLGAMRRAVVQGTVVASFTVQDFSIDRLRTLTLEEIHVRYQTLRRLTYFEPATEDEFPGFDRALI